MDSLWDEEEDEEEDETIEVESSSEPVQTPDTVDQPSDTNSLVKPVENIDEVVGVYDQFEDIKKRLLSKQDVTPIQGSNHINKSGWRKIATAFNLSVETVDIQKDVTDGVVTYTVTSKAVAPNGKSSSSTGMCASNESNHMEFISEDEPDNSDSPDVMKVDGKWRRLKTPKEVNHHNIMATAETRAKNRAISDLVGGGTVSAEEMKSKILE